LALESKRQASSGQALDGAQQDAMPNLKDEDESSSPDDSI
jgi:hypothetical protein